MLHTDRLEQLNKQIVIGEKIDVLMEQSMELMNIVNKNQSKINELKIELDQLKTHTDNATDQIAI
jgi:hypothetical protein